MRWNERYLVVIIALLLLPLLPGCAGLQPVPAEMAAVQRTIEIKGVSRDKLFDASKIWIARKLPSDSKGTDTVDRSSGTIVYHGIISMPTTAITEIVENRLIRFILREEVTDGRVVVTFDNVTLVTPEDYSHVTWSGGRQRPVRTPDELSQVRYVLGNLAADLEKHLNSGGAF